MNPYTINKTARVRPVSVKIGARSGCPATHRPA